MSGKKKVGNKVLILGASSDIGIEVVKLFLKNNYVIDAHYCKNISKLKKYKNLKIIKSNFFSENEKNILKKFSSNYSIIINLIGYVDSQSFQNFKTLSLFNSLRTNTIMPFLIIRKSISFMKKNKFGRVLNSSSIGVKFGGAINNFIYSFSKHGNEFIPQFFKKIANFNIFYNTLRIGLSNTKIHSRIKNKNLQERVLMVPTKKMAEPASIAKYIFFLSTEENSFITNEILSFSGGE